MTYAKNIVSFRHRLNLGQKFLVASLMGTFVGTGALPVRAEPALNQYATSGSQASGEVQVYGQAAEPGQLQKDYLVFQRHEDQIVGVYYQPRSEFGCFVGSLEDRALNVDFLSTQGQKLSEAQIVLSDLHSLASPSDNDRRMLDACRQQTAHSLDQTS